MADEMDENLENYKAQLKQVEAALLIDENNEDLQKLKQDLEEVIALSEELKQINDIPAEPTSDTGASSSIDQTIDSAEKKTDDKRWAAGDRVLAARQIDGEYHNAKIDMIADNGDSCTVKFDNIGSVEIVKISSLKPIGGDETKTKVSAPAETPKLGGKSKKDELERKREIKKKKLMKKKQRMKDFEEKRESEKQRWQTFFKKGTGKGKSKMKGINKKSIFASQEDGKGKIGVGTCGTSGKDMTSYVQASQYMYKK